MDHPFIGLFLTLIVAGFVQLLTGSLSPIAPPVQPAAVVILPEIVPGRWWQHLLHNQTTFQLKVVLLFRQERGGEARIVINVPYHLCG